MGGITVSLSIFIFGFLLIRSLIPRYARMVYHRMVTLRLQSIENLIETGEIPTLWRKSFLTRFTCSLENTLLFGPLSSLLQRIYLRKLDRAIGYVKTSTLVGGPEKESYLLELREIRMEWRKKSPGSFLH